jgi:hypothetical protein
MARKRTRAQSGVKMPDRKAENMPPGSRAVQRDSRTQIEGDRPPSRHDEATAWERELQERLPPRGGGSQHNQGEDRGQSTVRDEVADDVGPAPSTIDQTGGMRGPSKEPV